MPTYTYKCEKGHTFDIWQWMSEGPIEECPIETPNGKCNHKVHKVFNPTGKIGVEFKGAGFYCNDYGGKKYGE